MVSFCLMAKRFYPEHLRRRRRKLITIVAGSFLLILLGFGFWLYKRESSKVSWSDYVNNDLKVKLSYPETFVKDKISGEDKKARIVFRITKSNPPALFSLRYEDGLGFLKTFGGKDVLTNLVAEVGRRYPDRFPSYTKEGYEDITLANEKAAKFNFTYTGSDGKTKIRQHLVIVVRGETAYYLSCQAPENEFSKSEKDFDKIINSFESVD